MWLKTNKTAKDLVEQHIDEIEELVVMLLAQSHETERRSRDDPTNYGYAGDLCLTIERVRLHGDDEVLA